MNRELNLAVVTVSDKAKKSIQSNHPWVFEQEVLNVEGNYENGDLVDVFSLKNKYLGSGFISEKSKIRIRIISRNANDRFDDAFYERRLRHAWEYRKTVMQSDITNCRIIFGEADFFPGLTVDRFNNFLVTQTLSLGIEKIKHKLFPMLIRILREDGQIIDGLYERNDVAIRELEGLDQNKGWFLCEELPTAPKTAFTQICENGITYDVDVENGQKTGFFLDQKYNRLAISKLTQGKHVLDCFTHTGSFGLNAAKGGAERVVSVEISESAIAMAEKNAKANHLNVEYRCCDVFDLLDELIKSRSKEFDFIILDP
ncbi:MAG TPA: rRNA large subunit methyltransferase I, partial [Dielma fastidiosa]|nr:rRNA large subunit methyltransferase I [Dielma fastidiosa]